MKKEEKALNWCLRCAPGNWIIKRDESELLLVRISASVLAYALLIARQKRDIPLEKKEEKALSWCQRCAPGNWVIKREPEAPAEASPALQPVKRAKNATM